MATSVVDQAKEDRPHSSMMAWRVHEFGPPNVMRFERVLRPNPGPSEVLVKVEAAGVGPWDGWIRAGKSALPQPLPLTLGSDLSGEIIAVGPGVSDLRVGDQVYGVTNPQFVGAYAEYALASAAMVSRKPTSLTLSVLASCTILQPMRDGSVQHARAPVHAQDQRTKAETLATLEQMRADVDRKLKTTSGKYKLEWLLGKRKLDRLIEQANARTATIGIFFINHLHLFHHRSTGLDIHRRDGQSRGTEGDFFTSGTDNDQLSAFALLKRKKAAKVDSSRERGNTAEISTVTVATAGESIGSSTRLPKLRPLREY